MTDSSGGKFKCVPCDKTYSYKRSLVEHEKIKHSPATGEPEPDRPKCAYCGYVFSKNTSVIRHLEGNRCQKRTLSKSALQNVVISNNPYRAAQATQVHDLEGGSDAVLPISTANEAWHNTDDNAISAQSRSLHQSEPARLSNRHRSEKEGASTDTFHDGPRNPDSSTTRRVSVQLETTGEGTMFQLNAGQATTPLSHIPSSTDKRVPPTSADSIAVNGRGGGHGANGPGDGCFEADFDIDAARRAELADFMGVWPNHGDTPATAVRVSNFRPDTTLSSLEAVRGPAAAASNHPGWHATSVCSDDPMFNDVDHSTQLPRVLQVRSLLQAELKDRDLFPCLKRLENEFQQSLDEALLEACNTTSTEKINPEQVRYLVLVGGATMECSAIMAAIRSGRGDIVDALLGMMFEQGLSIDIDQMFLGLGTPLIQAVQMNQPGTVMALLRAGANPTVGFPCDSADSLAELALSHGAYSIAEMLSSPVNEMM